MRREYEGDRCTRADQSPGRRANNRACRSGSRLIKCIGSDNNERQRTGGNHSKRDDGEWERRGGDGTGNGARRRHCRCG